MPLPVNRPARVVVVGGGVTGLVAARDLAAAGLEVTVLEASDRLGGQLKTVDWQGARVDVGAEAIHLGAPHLKALAGELGLLDTVVAARPGQSWLYTPRHGLRVLPRGVGPTGPTRFLPVLKARGMTFPAILRAATEPLRARATKDDISVGEFTTRRFGAEVTRRFVEPLLGTLHAGDVHRLSLHATAAQLRGVAESGESMLLRTARQQRAARKARKSGPPPTPPIMFASWPGGLSDLVAALADDARAKGVDIRLTTPALALTRTPASSSHTGEYAPTTVAYPPVSVEEGGAEGEHAPGSAGDARADQGAGGGRPGSWRVRTPAGDIEADAVLVTTPAAQAAELLDPVTPGIGPRLREGRTADVATVLLAYRREDVARVAPMQGHNGVLLNSEFPGLLKASTFLSNKWAPYDTAGPFILRASVGRAGQEAITTMTDEQVVAAVREDLRTTVGLDAEPVDALVTRWPTAMPQLEVGHLPRMAAIRESLPAGIVLAGAPYDGLGLSSTVKSARAQAAHVIEHANAIENKGGNA